MRVKIKSRKEAAYQQIRSRLLSGAFSPGARLSHRALAKELGVSFIPVREALGQLASEGLVEHRPQIGTFVTELSREELAEIFDLREALECHVVGRVAGQLSAADLAAMQREIERQRAIVEEMIHGQQLTWNEDQQERWRQSDAGFHLVLLRAAGNCRLLKAVADLRVMVHSFGYRQRGRTRESMERIIADHVSILEVLARGDGVAAREVMARHLRQGCRDALQFYDQGRLQGALPAETTDRPHE
jgi:DNA-binding GntR family transcriptional regulator